MPATPKKICQVSSQAPAAFRQPLSDAIGIFAVYTLACVLKSHSRNVEAKFMAQVASHPMTVSDVIDRRPMGRFQIGTVVLCGVVLVLDGFDAQTLNFLLPSIAETTHIPTPKFGLVLSASLIGLMIAAMTTGPIADRWGRKWPVVLSTISFAVFSLLTAHAHTRPELLVLRFLTGLGLGGAMPNVVALASEYIPKRSLPVLISMLFIGMPLGGVICGFMSAAMVPKWGWPSVFYVGGIVPLLIALILIGVLPESIQFLAVRGENPARIAKTLARISPEFAGTNANLPAITRDERQKGVPVMNLFLEGRAAGTILLWVPYFMNLLLIYFIGGWLPALLREEGMSVRAGVTATAFISFGGVFGCLAEGHLMRWFGRRGVLVAQYAMAGLLIASLALISSAYAQIVMMTFGIGFMIIGAQGGLNALAASFYPIAFRSTGIGWALGFGRIGSIIGPLIGGLFLSHGWKTREMLLFAAGVAAIACASILLSVLIRGDATAYSDSVA
jgi:MFS transporter, AAHS family, 4-hydroxybenzoate transporter